MARNTEPIAKRCKALDISPAVLGYNNKKTIRNPGGDKRRKKVSEYGQQLKEKQKVRFVYGVLERQFRIYYKRAVDMRGVTGENLLQLLERRLDNVVFRLGFGVTRRHSRQLVNHGHFLVNGKKVDIPSYTLDADDIITVREKSREMPQFKALREGGFNIVPKWLTLNVDDLSATVSAMPSREDIDFPLQENMIVEFYSR